MHQTFIGIIPARWASSRFPGKPLAELGGLTVIERVYRQASKALDTVLVATDDERIATEVERFGGRAVMTRADHPSGTDRIREAYVKSGSAADVVINIQGDEPFVAPRQIAALKGCFDDASTDIATLVKPFDGTYDQLADPNRVKVVVDAQDYAMYFSRSVVPYQRGQEADVWPKVHRYFIHLGMYAYRAAVLERITALPVSALERAESLEQLRWLENGLKIKVAETDIATIGIDTPADLERAREFLNKNNFNYE